MSYLSAEETVAGMIMRGSGNLEKVLASGVSPDHFAEPLPKAVIRAALKASKEGLSIDFGTIVHFVGDDSALTLKRLLKEAPLAQNVDYFAKEVLAQARLFSLQERLVSLSSALETRRPYTELGHVETALSGLLTSYQGHTSFETVSVRDALVRSTNDLEKRVLDHMNGIPSGAPTGIRLLDRRLYGLRPGKVYVLGARTSVGKTTFAINTMVASAKAGFGVGFLTVEMKPEELMDKAIAAEGMIDFDRYQRGVMHEPDIDRHHHACKVLSGLPIEIVYVKEPVFEKIALEVRRLVRIAGVKVVVLDYLQQFTSETAKRKPRREEVGYISGELKILAQSLGIAILVLAQLNRGAAEAEEPELTHLAECDKISHDADAVMLLWADDKDDYWISLQKVRGGRRGKLPLKADLQFQRFLNAAVNEEAYAT